MPPVRAAPAARAAAPGLAAAAAGAVAAAGAAGVTGLPVLPVAVLVGVGAAAVAEGRGGLPAAWSPGLAVAARRCLRLGVVLLGLRVVAADLAALGVAGVAVVTAALAATFAVVLLLARAARLPRGAGVLLAAGYAVCGASAVAAVSAVAEADEDDVATALALVTLCGTLSIAALPAAAALLGLGAEQAGAWVGLAVHDVGQVVAAGAAVGPQALETAVVVKLVRVALLVPVVALVALSVRRRGREHGQAPSGAGGSGPSAGRSPALVPLFVVGFLLAAVVRSTGILPPSALVLADGAREALMAVALVALGAGVRPRRLVRTGRSALLVGLVAWAVVAVLGLAGATLLVPR